MKTNMGFADRIIRFLFAIVIGILYFTKVIDGTLAMALGILALVFLGTSLISFCPLYVLLGFNTCKKTK